MRELKSIKDVNLSEITETYKPAVNLLLVDAFNSPRCKVFVNDNQYFISVRIEEFNKVRIDRTSLGADDIRLYGINIFLLPNKNEYTVALAQLDEENPEIPLGGWFINKYSERTSLEAIIVKSVVEADNCSDCGSIVGVQNLYGDTRGRRYCLKCALNNKIQNLW